MHKLSMELSRKARLLANTADISLDDALKIVEDQQENDFRNDAEDDKEQTNYQENDDQFDDELLRIKRSRDTRPLMPTSQDWLLLSSESSTVINCALHILHEETLKYENGNALYPYIEYAIGLAKDRIHEQEIKTQQNIENARKIEQDLILQRDQTDQNDVQNEELGGISAEELRNKVRASWSSVKF